MKRTFYNGASMSLSALLFASIVFVGCEKKEIGEESSVTEQLEKIETTFSGGEKIENVAIKKNSWLVSKETEKRIDREIVALQAANVKRYSSTRNIYNGYDVGVIPAGQTCPSWSEMVHFFMDNEDDATSSTSLGWVGSWSNDGNGNSHLRFCRVDGRLFPTIGQYSVLALGNQRAAAFETTVYMYIDNEDKRNTNSHDGDIFPNIRTENTNLYIYSSKDNGQSGGVGFPDFGFSYGVWSGRDYGLADALHGWFLSDDQDGGNVNQMAAYTGDPSMVGREFYNGNLMRSLISYGDVISYRDWQPPMLGATYEKSASEFWIDRIK